MSLRRCRSHRRCLVSQRVRRSSGASAIPFRNGPARKNLPASEGRLGPAALANRSGGATLPRFVPLPYRPARRKGDDIAGAIEVLKQDHKTVEDLFKRYEEAEEDTPRRAVCSCSPTGELVRALLSR